MQQQQSMIHAMPSHPSTNISTEQIQKYLDENRRLILAILDNQNLGKIAECAKYQAVLQKNLMYLAAIADAQPPQAQTPAMPPQMAAHPQMQQGGYFMQHPQMGQQQQSGLFPHKVPMQFSSPHQLQSQDHPQMHHQHHGQGSSAVDGSEEAN